MGNLMYFNKYLGVRLVKMLTEEKNWKKQKLDFFLAEHQEYASSKKVAGPLLPRVEEWNLYHWKEQKKFYPTNQSTPQ